MNPLKSPLLTDLYQLTMLQGYIDQEMHEEAVFEFFIRNMPESRNFFVAAGLETVLEFLEECRFSEEEIAYLEGTGRFTQGLLQYLRQFKFKGDVHALPEGTIFFPNEPVIRITAPIPEAQLIESRIINIIHCQSLIATKAARCYLAAEGKATLIDFGLRRTHGAEAGLFAARASFIAGFTGTSTVIAESLYGIPIFGTMAHSFIEAQKNEKEAFINFALSNPGNVTLLIDTYDTLKGAEKVVETAKSLEKRGIEVNAVRLDSGDLAELSRKVRTILDEGGLKDVQIFVSGNLDEFMIRDLFKKGAPIGGFGVGTRLDTSADVPYFDCAYKLTEYGGKPKLKKSEGKATWPGPKQVFRTYEGAVMSGDVITTDKDKKDGTPLLRQFMKRGKRLEGPQLLEEIKKHTLHEYETLPLELKSLEKSDPYPVEISGELVRLKQKVEEKLP
ncbi:MAG: nicotinate phosphoribosyltransferase [Thermodesulfobacteriota bacterium]|nr:nicotinate phosphoribosyltransferase [Thermodesulfobacteriota bacterium]